MRPSLSILACLCLLICGCKSAPKAEQPDKARDEGRGIKADNVTMQGLFKRIGELAK